MYVVLSDVTQTGPWATKLEEATFEPQKAALDVCEKSAPPWRDWWGQQMIVEVDIRGHVGRCESEMPDHLPRPEFACQCQVVRTMVFGPASAPRRASFDLDLARVGATVDTVRSATIDTFTASDPSAILGTGTIDEATVEACLAPVAASTTATAHVDFEVSADGRVTHTTLAPIAGVPTSVQACLEGALGRSRFNCPLSGTARVGGELKLKVVVPARGR